MNRYETPTDDPNWLNPNDPEETCKVCGRGIDLKDVLEYGVRMCLECLKDYELED